MKGRKRNREEGQGRYERLTFFLDDDCLDNLMVSVKYEPQSLHWSHEHITAVHLKYGGDKSYQITNMIKNVSFS